MLGGLSTLQIRTLSLEAATQAAYSILDLPVRRPGELSGALKRKPAFDASSTDSEDAAGVGSNLTRCGRIFGRPPLVGAAAA